MVRLVSINGKCEKCETYIRVDVFVRDSEGKVLNWYSCPIQNCKGRIVWSA